MNVSVLLQDYYLTRTLYQAYVHLCSASFQLSGRVDDTTQEAICGQSSGSLTLSHLRAALKMFLSKKLNGVSIQNYELPEVVMGEITYSIII